MADFNKTVDLDKGLNQILDKIDRKAEELQQRGQDAGESFGIGWDDGLDYTVEKIKASSIKTDKAFKNLGEKIKKQVQQLTTNVNGKDIRFKIDFSDIDMNSDVLKKRVKDLVGTISDQGIIEFDTKGFEKQFKNFITLYVKYQEKLASLREVAPKLSGNDVEVNLRQQVILMGQLQEMFDVFNNPNILMNYFFNLNKAKNELIAMQKVVDKTQGGNSQPIGEYNELAKVLNEIQGSLKIISDTFVNENNSMKAMAKDGTKSFTSLSQVIIEVYNNLVKVQGLVDTISQKDFNVTNITNPAPTSAPTSKRQGVKQLKAEVEAEMQHVKTLYAEIDKLLMQLQQGRMNNEFRLLAGTLNELDATTYEDFEKTMLGQMADAKTKVKIENLLVVLDGYIDKLTVINKLREQYGLGEWQDPFAKPSQPTVQPTVQPKPQATETPIVARPQNTVATTNTEAQQMYQLKAAIDEVTNAIGRKNAGFVKEAEIVDTSVKAEEERLRELIGVITTEIGNALDGIKEKFTQSFVVPELDKNNLQASFDEIYNKFVELKDKIQTMQIDIGINTANVTQAIQEALYAKEIAANYKPVIFEDIFKKSVKLSGAGDTFNADFEYINKLTGEVFDTLQEASQIFKNNFKNKFVSNDAGKIMPKNHMIEEIVEKMNIDTSTEQNDWAQVIVEAINTQGNNIVQAIKLMLPKNISDGVDNGTIDEKKISDAFQTLSDFISKWSMNTGKRPGDLFREMLSSGQVPGDGKIHDAFSALGMVSDFGEMTFTMPDTGMRNLGVAISDNVVATIQDKMNSPNTPELMKKLDEAYKLGASVPRILSLAERSVSDGWSGSDNAIFQLQTRSPGINIASSRANNDFSGVTDEQIDRLIHTFEVMSKVGLFPDFIGDNILFDKQKGFSLIDLETENIHAKPMDDPQDMVQAFLKNVFREANLSSSEFQRFSDRINQRLNLPTEQRLVNANTIVAEQMVASQTKTETKPSEVKIAPIMDEGAVAKIVADNVAKTPATVKVTPVVDSASHSEQAVDGESQSATDAAKTFVDAANAKLKFVEANKQVAESAEESAKAVEEEAKAAEQTKQKMTAVADDTTQPSDWDKVAQLQADHGEDPFALRRSKTENAGDKSVRTIVESWTAIKDEDGNLTGEMELNTVQIINDFKKRTDAIAKESEKIKTAQAYLQKFLTQFDNKTMGKGSLLSGYKDLEELANRDNNDPDSKKFTIDDIAKAEQMMSNLDAEYNKVVQSMRKGSSSMNPFVNAINGIGKMEDVLRGIYLQFQTLKQQPEWLKNQIIDLYKQFDNVSAESDIYKFAEGFGNLRVSINSVTESIRQQRIEQKLATADFNALIKATKTRDTNTEKAAKEKDGSVWKTYYMDRAAEQQKIIDAIRIGLVLTEDQEAQLNAMSEKHALILNDITQENNKIEEQKQKYEEIMRLLEKNHTDQIELDNDTSLNASDRKAYQQILDEERAEIDALIASTDLNPEQAKSVKQLRGSMEDDRIAKVKEYINLLRLQQDYEKKAAKEDKGSKMQSFYNEQIAKVKEKINQIDITAIENQDEKNKRLAIEEAHQRAIAEIEAKKNANVQNSVMPFDSEDGKIQKKYEAGYLRDGLYQDWQKELAEYRNYMSGVTEADELTIQNKKQSLMQMYDALTKMSNASKSFFASGGEMLPVWFTPEQMQDTKKSLMDLYNTIATERFEGMQTSVTSVSEKLGKLNFVIDDGNGSLTQYTIALDKASGATKLLDNSTKPTLTTLQRFGQHLKKDFTGLLHSIIGGSGIHAFVGYIKKGVQAVRELDLALTELKKVTDATEETYDRFLGTAAETSSRIGRTITDMTSATAEFAKLGYNIDMAASMAESALVYANVGDNVDVETGSQSIISTLKAFGIEANNTMSIVDKFNEVGNNFAITTKGIGDALQVSASAMAAAGNSLDETIALTTAANTIVQNPNTVGTALKTLSLRIRGVKTELEEAGLETDGMAETTSQLQAKLKALTDGKVDIMIDANNFKNTTQILREMAAEWENLTDVEQAAALELLGGRFCLCV